jgi:hypothetical protein
MLVKLGVVHAGMSTLEDGGSWIVNDSSLRCLHTDAQLPAILRTTPIPNHLRRPVDFDADRPDLLAQLVYCDGAGVLPIHTDGNVRSGSDVQHR